jgi:hypothetical protein
MVQANAYSPAFFEEDFHNPRALVDLDPLLLGVPQHHEIELTSHHLPSLRAFMRLVVEKIERGGYLAAGTDELNAIFLDEMARIHFVEHFEPAEDPIGLRDQRLADVEAREPLALEELDSMAPLGNQRRDRAAGWTAPDDDHIRHFATVVGNHDELRNRKFEIRSTKSETNSNTEIQMFETGFGTSLFGIFFFDHLDLFRILGFVFRISNDHRQLLAGSS